MADLEESNESGYSGMSGMTSYNRVEGEFFLRQMPSPDEQIVKQTIQGVVDEFIYKTDEVSLQSIIKENEQVSVTENVYYGESSAVVNETKTAYSTDSSDEPFNRMVIQAGVGSYSDDLSADLSASVFDEVIAIAVENIEPFMIKGLDIDYTAGLVNDKPTNDGYIKHLTPSDEPFIASIQSPTILTDAGGPSRVLVYYDAIDLTGEVVAGTTLTPSEVNAQQRTYHVEGENKGYLVVKKMIPSATTLYEVSSGTWRSLSDILLKPYSSTPSNDSDVQLTITAPGGLISLPTKDFKRPIKSHLLKSHGFGGAFPSPFIDVSDCIIAKKSSKIGYGRPRRVANPNTPDTTANPRHHVMTIQSNTGNNLKSYDGTKRTPSELSRSTLQVFNVIDNMVRQNEHVLLVAPANKNRYAVFDDFLTNVDSANAPSVSIEVALLNGRAEEFNTEINNGEASLEMRGRSNLMDLTDKETQRNLNLGESVPIKEIGDIGTPTVTLTLGGVGQGGADTKPEWTEHNFLKGWKDRVVGSGNVSVRNDHQTSTDYASTRALVELPLFPSMFYDVDGIYGETDSITNGVHPDRKNVQLTVDCTMTAKNRVQMRNYESRQAVDWGMQDSWAAIEIDRDMPDSLSSGSNSYALKAQMPSIQAVITGFDLDAGTANSYITVDDTEAFVNEILGASFGGPDIDETTGVLENKFYITVGEGLVAPTTDPTLTYCTYLMFRVHKIDDTNNRIYVDKAFLRYPRNDLTLNLSSTAPKAEDYAFTGATVVLGGVIVSSTLSAHNETLKVNYAGNPKEIIERLRDELGDCLGLENSVFITEINTVDGQNKYHRNLLIIKNHIGMGGLEWDIFNEWGADNNRELREPIVCFPNFTGLKGIDSSGSNLRYVFPNTYDFRDIALKSDGFDSSVNELIRQINMNGHPLAKTADGRSAFDPPAMLASAPTQSSGGHMGYVRAYLGKEVESRDGEKGRTIVIHSTVPGATGREFAVWIKNDSAYPYRPIQAIGHGGLLATNSRSYQSSSFPAPMPLGADGETFAPITTFTGAPHGTVVHPLDSDDNIREYNGVGSRFIVQTKQTSDSSLHLLNGSYSWDNTNKKFSYITVEGKAMDYALRSRSSFNGDRILLINGYFCTFDEVMPQQLAGKGADGECAIINVKPLKDADKFVKEFYDGAFNTYANEVAGFDVEFIYPLIDSEGILFFGGGHTGLTFDISDGTDNDYSNQYKHPLANGPTGFSGFQNLGEISAPVAILDFTDVLNEDTINADTLKGFHHTTVLNSNNTPEGRCAFYARLQNGLYGTDEDLGTGAVSQDASKWREDLYNRKVRVTSANGMSTTANGVTNGTEVTPTGATIKAKMFDFGDVVALHNNNSGTVEAEHGEVKNFNPSGADWCISAICYKNSNLGYMTGPIFHSIYDDGTNNGKPYGLHLGGGAVSNGNMPISVAISYPTTLPIGSPVLASVLVPSTVSGGTVEVDETGWTFIMAGRSPSGTNATFLYIGNTVGITNPETGAMEAGIFDFSDYVVNVGDEHYGATGTSPNSKTNFETETSGYSGGDNDHPDCPSAIHTIRDKNMTTIGCALIGSPYIELTASMNTQGGHACPAHSGYFTGLITVVQPPPPPPPAPPPPPSVPTYGVTDTSGTNGEDTAGPIHFAGYLTDVALWTRAMSFTDASTWFAGRNKW
jgi:hypothetical protein